VISTVSPGALERPATGVSELRDMTDNDLDKKERIAREVADKPFDELTPMQQRVVESCANGVEVEDPFGMLRREDA